MICLPPTAPVSSPSSSLVIFSHIGYFSVTQSQQPLSLFMAFAHVVPSACTCLLLHCLCRLIPYPSGLNLHVIPPTSAVILCLCPLFSFMITYHGMYLLYTPVYLKKNLDYKVQEIMPVWFISALPIPDIVSGTD